MSLFLLDGYTERLFTIYGVHIYYGGRVSVSVVNGVLYSTLYRNEYHSRSNVTKRHSDVLS